MLLVLVITVLGFCACELSAQHYYSVEHAALYFQEYKRDHNKSYPSKEEEQKRLKIFKDNLILANEANKKSKTALYGITKFMDLTRDEFREMYTGFNESNLGDMSCQTITDADVPDANAPDSFDWRESNVVTGIKSQARCGSCWAFSTIGNVESQYAKKYKELVDLSEQQLVDCDDRSNGCNGGSMVSAMSKLIEQGGCETENDYPYTAADGQCQFDKSRVVVKVVGCHDYNLMSAEKLKNVAYSNGPLSIALKSTYLQIYRGGIVSAEDCDQGNIDHGVLLVGYGVENGTPFWIAKNSWGPQWGEEGFFRLERSDANACSIMNPSMASAIVG